MTAVDPQPAARRPLSTAVWLLITILLGLPLITPLLRWLNVPCTHDGHLHYHRIAAMNFAWDNGITFTRWLPDLAFGYGYPFFIFREAPPLYLPFLLHQLGLPLPAATNLFYALTILAAGVFMFLWVRDLFGERAGVVAAVAYMAAPYVLVDALIRGNSPESLALPLFPFLLWIGRRWLLSGSLASFAGAVGGLALLSLSHNISTLIFVPTLLVYLIAIAILYRADLPVRQLAGRLVLLFALGLGLAFFYTGGALLEMDQVTLEQSTTTRNNDWRLNFASLGEILAPVAPEDPNLVNPPLLFRLGWIPTVLALIGLSGLAWIRGDSTAIRERRAHIWLMAAGAVAFLLMALPASWAAWDNLPLIEFVQFPWRFVGRAALPVAFLAGVPFAHPLFDRATTTTASPGPSRWLVLLVPLAAGLLLLETLPNLYPRMCREDGFPTINDVHRYERDTGLVGVDPEGSYFPRTVEERPSGSPLEADYLAGTTPQRFDLTSLPAGATVAGVTYGRNEGTLTLDTPEPFTLRYLSFDFPGWEAVVDGVPATITPEEPSGLITLSVPPGQHTITVEWQATPLRWALTVASLLALLATVGVMGWLWRRSRGAPITPPALHLWRWELAALALVGAGMLGVKLVVADRQANAAASPSQPPVAQSTSLQAADWRLNGFTLDREQVAAGSFFEIDMAWTAVSPPAVDYQSNVWLVGPDGLVWSDRGTERPRIYEDAPPTRQWAAGEWGWDSREVTVLPGTPPGVYDIIVIAFDKETLQPLTFVDLATGAVVGPEATVGQMTVVNPAEVVVFTPQFPLAADLPAYDWHLAGYNQDRETAAPGEALLLTLFLGQPGQTPATELLLRLVSEDGATAVDWTLPVARADFPREAWAAGQQFRSQQLLTLPADLPGGAYRFELGDDLSLGTLAVVAPERLFEEPPLSVAVDDGAFHLPDGDAVATLVGVLADETSVDPLCLTPPDTIGPCTLSLVWRVEQTPETGYHVFVHVVDDQVVDETGTIVAQSDGVPGAWERPSTGWLPGEYIIDPHVLMLPETGGPWRLRVGLYDPATGERLETAEGEFLTIEQTGE